MADEQEQQKGVNLLLNQGQLVYERLPMLEVVLDRLMRLLTTSLRNFTMENVELTVVSPKPIRFGEYMDGLQSSPLLVVFQAEEWDDVALLVIDNNLALSLVEILLGGRRSTPTKLPENRPFTLIERRLVERLSTQILMDLSSSFEPVSGVHFRFDRLETNPRFTMIAKPADVCILMELTVAMESRGGTIQILFPLATLEPVRETLLQMFMGEKFGRDSIWEGHLAQQLWGTDVEIEAILAETEVSLTETLKWQVGSCLELDKEINPLVNAFCGDVKLFTGHIGQQNGFIALRIEDIIDRREPSDD